jgi:hypothetical protein
VFVCIPTRRPRFLFSLRPFLETCTDRSILLGVREWYVVRTYTAYICPQGTATTVPAGARYSIPLTRRGISRTIGYYGYYRMSFVIPRYGWRTRKDIVLRSPADIVPDQKGHNTHAE